MAERTIPVTAMPCRVTDLRPRMPITRPMIPVTMATNPKQGMKVNTMLMMPSTRLVTACPAPGSGGAATTYGYGAGCTYTFGAPYIGCEGWTGACPGGGG